MSTFTSGNSIVDEVACMHFTGNVIPQRWYKKILKETGKPDLLAIILLADIVYWYRPIEERDEATGQLTGFRTKFHKDLLQRDYSAFADQFGESKRNIRDAMARLEHIGVIRRDFRTIVTQTGMKCSNVLFIELIPEKLYEITNGIEEGYLLRKNVTPMTKNGLMDIQKNVIGGTQNRKTNTEITTEISSSSSSCERKQEEIEEEDKIKKQIDYKALGKEYGHAVDLLISAILDLSPEHRKKVTYEMADNICRTYKANKSRVVIPKTYIRKCLESALDGGAPPDRASPKRKGNSFVDSCMTRSDIDFESLENKLLNL